MGVSGTEPQLGKDGVPSDARRGNTMVSHGAAEEASDSGAVGGGPAGRGR